MQDHEHPQRTRRSQFRYLFTAKHHSGGKQAAQWAALVTEDEEFSVFDLADLHEIVDERQWLYGVLQDSESTLRYLGTFYQQVAVFPFASANNPWHGYPVWTVSEPAPAKLRGDKFRPARSVFDKLLAASLVTAVQRKRLLKGDHA